MGRMRMAVLATAAFAGLAFQSPRLPSCGPMLEPHQRAQPEQPQNKLYFHPVPNDVQPNLVSFELGSKSRAFMQELESGGTIDWKNVQAAAGLVARKVSELRKGRKEDEGAYRQRARGLKCIEPDHALEMSESGHSPSCVECSVLACAILRAAGIDAIPYTLEVAVLPGKIYTHMVLELPGGAVVDSTTGRFYATSLELANEFIRKCGAFSIMRITAVRVLEFDRAKYGRFIGLKPEQERAIYDSTRSERILLFLNPDFEWAGDK